MKRFQFKFDAVLRVKKMREDEALRALAESQRAYQAEISRKEVLKNELSHAFQRREQLGSGPVSITAFRTEQDYIVGLKQRLVHSDQSIFRASKNVEKALRSYLIAKKQSRVIETLYDRALAEYRKEKSKFEQKRIDDLVLMRQRLKEEEA
jgi:flagellar export protein FliJ